MTSRCSGVRGRAYGAHFVMRRSSRLTKADTMTRFGATIVAVKPLPPYIGGREFTI